MKTTQLILTSIAMIAILTSADAQERRRLYTSPEAGAKGGIKGTVSYPSGKIVQALAICTDEPRKVYEGSKSGNSFSFSGLPMAKYDLVIIYDNSFYEGCVLHRGESTLTSYDIEKIDYIINHSEMFFTKKKIHRVAGETGRANLSRAICTFVRDKGSMQDGAKARADWRRTIKLVMLKDVGPGWQVVRTRDLFPIWTKPSGAWPTHNFTSTLSKIRVTDYVKDLGNLNLSR